jgi:hypothetical protein
MLALMTLLACSDQKLTVNLQPPAVSIVAPAEGSRFLAGEVVTVEAVIRDEDALDALFLSWSSDLQGDLGGQQTLLSAEELAWYTTSALEPGAHTLLLQVTDSDGQETWDQVGVEILENTAPTLSLVSPAEGAQVAAGQDLWVEIAASDAEQSAETLALSWSLTGGALGEVPASPGADGRASFAVAAIAPGAYTLTVTVTDGQGAATAAGVSFEAIDADADGDGYDDVALGGEDCDDSDGSVHPGAEEICDGLGVDEDCDGLVDADDPGAAGRVKGYTDGDGDGWGSGEVLASCGGQGLVSEGGDCDDGDVGVNPGASEACDGVDQDCDAAVDEGVTSTFFVDADDDGYGDPAGALEACAAAAGYAESGEDCDDGDGGVFPGAAEACDEVDQDCDAAVDEGVTSTFFVDADDDGYGDPASTAEACEVGEGFSESSEDCDDSDGGVFPGAAERCDEIDQDCDGDVDEDASDATTWYTDGDGDGWGDDDGAVVACAAPEGGLASGGDCDGGDAAVNPDASEACDAIDNDCDGEVDEAGAEDAAAWYADADGDGYGDPLVSEVACEAPEGFTADATDCEDDPDAGGEIHPGAEEVCDDGVDNDCDGGAGDCRLEGVYSVPDGALLVYGETNNDEVGGVIAGGDADGDGCLDLLLGAPAAGYEGKVYVFPGCGSVGERSVSESAAVISGLGNNDELGAALVSADLDGDEVGELVVGVPRLDGAKVDEVGGAWIFAGPVSGELAASDGDVAIGDDAGTDGQRLGAALALADFDGDGLADLAVAAPEADPYGTRTDGGAIYLFLDPAAGGDLDAADADFSLVGDDNNDQLGEALAVMDLDGDGLPDLAASAPYDSDNVNDAGAVYVFLVDELTGAHNSSQAELVVRGVERNHEIGAALAAGDLDGDGADELVIGAPLWDDPETDAGAVYVVSGVSSGDYTLDDEGVVVATIAGEEASELAGSALAAGDLDGDGCADLLVGGYGSTGDTNYSNSGRAGLFYGPLSGALTLSDAPLLVQADENYERAGAGVALPGDLGGDGVPDMVVGAPRRDDGGSNAGAVSVFEGEGL